MSTETQNRLVDVIEDLARTERQWVMSTHGRADGDVFKTMAAFQNESVSLDAELHRVTEHWPRESIPATKMAAARGRLWAQARAEMTLTYMNYILDSAALWRPGGGAKTLETWHKEHPTSALKKAQHRLRTLKGMTGLSPTTVAACEILLSQFAILATHV